MLNGSISVDTYSFGCVEVNLSESKMEKVNLIRIFIEYLVIIFVLHLMYCELMMKSGEINCEFVVKLICSIRKFQNQHQNNSNDQLQSLFLIILKNFIMNSLNLDALIIR